MTTLHPASITVLLPHIRNVLAANRSLQKLLIKLPLCASETFAKEMLHWSYQACLLVYVYMYIYIYIKYPYISIYIYRCIDMSLEKLGSGRSTPWAAATNSFPKTTLSGANLHCLGAQARTCQYQVAHYIGVQFSLLQKLLCHGSACFRYSQRTPGPIATGQTVQRIKLQTQPPLINLSFKTLCNQVGLRSSRVTRKK